MKKIYLLLFSLVAIITNAQPTRNWGTYYGGTNNDYVYSAATDAAGNVYICGQTGSTSSISTVGSQQPTFGGGTYDAFVAKFNSAGVRQWATYYGSTGDDYGYSVATDASGNIYLVGKTTSTTGISSAGSHQVTYGGGTDDVFLVKFNSSGVRQWATYYGGTDDDICQFGRSVAVDPVSGNVYIGGTTSSTTSIGTAGSHQPSIGIISTGVTNAFLVQFNSAGVRQWGTYYGGTGGDYGYAVKTDGSGNVYLTGLSTSTNAISTPGSQQPVNMGADGYLVKFNGSGVRQWGTYYGGNSFDYGTSIATDASGNVYLLEYTASNTGTGIGTAGSHQPAFGGNTDAALMKFNSSGVLQWGTYYGGTSADYSFSAEVDQTSGNIYIAGWTGSTNAISTPGSYQPTLAVAADAFIVQFDPAGVRQWGTYYGGTGGESAYAIALTGSGTFYLAGGTTSSNSISTAGSYQPLFTNTNDAMLIEFANCAGIPTQPIAINGTTILCSGAPATSYNIATVGGATSYIWSLPSGWSGTSTTNTISATPGSSGTFSVSAINACGTSPVQTLSITVNALPTITATANNSLICTGQNATLTAGGASTYTWNTTANGSSISVSPTITTVYSLTGTDNNGCVNTASVTLNVSACTGISQYLALTTNISVYPNPFTSKITVDAECTQLQIFNSLGSLIFNTKIENNKTEINLSEQPNGIYFIKIGTVIKKIIKE